MTKFVIHTEVEEEEQEIRLALRKTIGNAIQLHVVNKKGEHVAGYNILTITEKGTLIRHGGLRKNRGFILEGDGVIQDETL